MIFNCLCVRIINDVKKSCDERGNEMVNNKEKYYETINILTEEIYINKKDKECLKNIDIKIKSGETIGIIGGTGTGKSTFVNLIPRLYDVTEGEVKVGDIVEIDVENNYILDIKKRKNLS